MGNDDAAKAAKDRLDMVGPVCGTDESISPHDENCYEESDVCGQVGLDCRDCGEVLYHPHELQRTLTEVQAKKILWELGQLSIDSADVGTNLRDRDRLQALMAKAAKRIGHIIDGTG